MEMQRLTASDLATLVAPAGSGECSVCAPLRCAGWESLPGGYDPRSLHRIGTLRLEGDDDPTLQEYHPAGTNQWSADAPISPRHHPYNKCDVHVCSQCRRPFLRYTEYGGYYTDERIREVNPALVVDVKAPDR